MWRLFKYFFAFLLGHTPQNSKFLALRPQLLVVVQAMENFLLGLVANGAGVVENQVGLFDRLYLGISLLNEGADDFFRVVDIHLTAKSLDVKRFLLRLRHSKTSIQGIGDRL